MLAVAACVLITFANAGAFAFVFLKHGQQPTAAQVIQDAVEPKIEVTNAEKRTVDATLQGKKIGEGSYKSETLAKSKITTGSPAKLVIAAHEPTGGHFVLAFLNNNIPGADRLEQGWSLQTIANDPMWAPGACSSKPSFLVKNKYIFIDDGKTDPDDLYSSYVMFDMHTGQYRYFGGDNFTEEQGKKENILLTVNENDKLVFYIDPLDEEPYFAYTGAAPGHTRGKDHAYMIRREIDPDSLDYTDYSLPFSVPEDLPIYSVYTYTYNNEVRFTFSAPYNANAPNNGISYRGRLEANAIHISAQIEEVYGDGSVDSDLDVQIDGLLRASLPGLTKQNPPGGGFQAKTIFTATELGSYKGIKFLNITQRNGQTVPNKDYSEYFSTPLVFDNGTKQVYPMVTATLIRSYSDYVNLGAF